MVGRQAQLQELREQLAQAQRGLGRIVFVAGDAGVGKTRLVREFVGHVEMRSGCEVFEGHCYDERPAAPYSPFIDVLRSFVRAKGAEVVVQAAGPWSSDLAKLLPELKPAAPQPISADDLRLQKHRLFEAIYAVLRPQDNHPCHIVVLEDLHWSDQTSQELLRYLARMIARDRLLIVATYRTDELHRRHPLTHLLSQLTRERLYHEVRLLPLSQAELGDMLRLTLDRPLSGMFVNALYHRTEGNPFFAEEVLSALIERAQLDPLLEAAQSGKLIDRLEIPASIRDSILSRISDLDETTTEGLDYAAVIGRRFDFELLLRLTSLSEV